MGVGYRKKRVFLGFMSKNFGKNFFFSFLGSDDISVISWVINLGGGAPLTLSGQKGAIRSSE